MRLVHGNGATISNGDGKHSYNHALQYADVKLGRCTVFRNLNAMRAECWHRDTRRESL